MTDIVDDVQDQDTLSTDQTTVTDKFIEDTDPMIVAMKEAEAEIAKENGQNSEEVQAQQAQTTEEVKTDDPKAEPQDVVMIPKPRLDQTLSKLKFAEDKITYLQGVVDTQTQILKSGNTNQVQEQGKPNVVADPDYATLISQIEDKKLEIAKQYEEGEISLVEQKKQEIALDREIRKLDDKRYAALAENAKTVAKETIDAGRAQTTIESEAIEIGKQHPYVAEIDKLPEAIRDGIWKQITKEAVSILTQKGINPNDNSLETRFALMKEKALLTDKYGPRYTGTQINPITQTEPKPAVLSEKAQNRVKKLELADSQPPSSSNMGVNAIKSQLTEQDVLAMSDDQMADYIKANPQLVADAVGLKKL